MKFQTIVTHAISGMKSTSEWNDITKEELDDFKEMIKSNLPSVKYLEIGSDLWPGDLIRSSCIITFNTKETE